MPAFTVSMPADVLAYAEQRAAQDGISRSAWLTRLVMTAQLADEERPDPEAGGMANQAPPAKPGPVPDAERATCPDCNEDVPVSWIGQPHKVKGKPCGYEPAVE